MIAGASGRANAAEAATSHAALLLGGLGPAYGVHLLHSMDDTFAVMRTLEETGTGSAVIVGTAANLYVPLPSQAR